MHIVTSMSNVKVENLSNALSEFIEGLRCSEVDDDEVAAVFVDDDELEQETYEDDNSFKSFLSYRSPVPDLRSSLYITLLHPYGIRSESSDITTSTWLVMLRLDS